MLKGQCQEIFDLFFFFHESNPAGPLINRLKCFQLFFRFSRDIRSQSCLRGEQHTTKSPIFFCKSTFYTSNLSFHGTCRCVHHPKRFLLIVPLKATRDKQRFQFWLRGVQCFSAVWCTPGRLSLRSAAQCTLRRLSPQRDGYQKFFEILCLRLLRIFGKIDSKVWCTPRRLT